ncbi:MAG TPA: ABC transporter permease [Vicinamibacterales bacterium]|nr:ABC transporter permease [Vicinamibacterales bacterium]
MRDWRAFVAARLALDTLEPERAARIVRELAAQLEDFARDARERGAGDAEADAFAEQQVADWARLSADLRRADRPHTRSHVDRLADALVARPEPAPFRGGSMMLSHTLRDGRHAVRQLMRMPGFTLVAVLTLGLGVGATTAIFSVVNGVLLQPLPFPEPHALVHVHEVVPQYGRFSVAPATFLDWREQGTSFEHIAAFGGTSGTHVGDDGPERLTGAAVSWDLFELLGVRPALGSGFTADQDVPGANTVIVLSHRLWQRRFGGDASIVGRAVTLDGVALTVVGIAPESFVFPATTTEFWRPIAINPANATRGGHFLGVIARLKDGVTVEQAGSEVKTISERLAIEYPDSSANESAEIVPLHDQIVGPVRPALLTLLAAVTVVVLIACANVANLLLVRATVREKEVAIRAALGAGRRRLVVQMLVESAVLALAGGALGVGLAYLAIAPIQSLSAGSIPRVTGVAIDGAVLAFALGAAVLTGLLFGLVPAWRASSTGFGAVLKEGGRSSSGGGRWLQNGLIVVEVALSVVLIVGALLLLKSFGRITGVDPGFRSENVLAFQVSLPARSYAADPQRIAFFEDLQTRLQVIPGVRAAGMVQSLPMRGSYVLSVVIDKRPPLPPGEGISANYRAVDPGYFDALSIPLRRGRTFTARDTETAPMVAVVDEAFVRRHFPDEDPIGRGIDIGNGTDGFYEIVGIVGDVRHAGLALEATPTMYVPYRSDVFSTMWVVARAEGDPVSLAGPIRQVIRDLDPSLPAYSMTPLATVLSDSVARRRFSMLLLALFAGVALFLAGVGLYGVVSYTVNQRVREIGLRMAMGATPRDVLRLIVGGGLKLVVAGVAVGLVAAVSLTRFVEAMLFDVAPTDPWSYAGTAFLLIAIAAIACLVPARRAMRVDPIVALHET